MSALLDAALRDLRSLQEAEAVVAGREPHPHVFSAPNRSPLYERAVRRLWARFMRGAGLRYRKIHTLRHAFALLLLEAGEPILYV